MVFLGKEIAKTLGVPLTADLTWITVELNQNQFSVAGFLTTDTSLSREIVLPYRVGLRLVGSDAYASMLVFADIGAGAPVARVVRHALLPIVASAYPSLWAARVQPAVAVRSN